MLFRSEEAEELGPLDADDGPTLSGHVGGDAPRSSGHTSAGAPRSSGHGDAPAASGPVDPLDYAEAESPAIGSTLSRAAEREQELLDSLRLVGFPDHEQARRTAWLKLPRSQLGPQPRLKQASRRRKRWLKPRRTCRGKLGKSH